MPRSPSPTASDGVSTISSSNESVNLRRWQSLNARTIGKLAIKLQRTMPVNPGLTNIVNLLVEYADKLDQTKSDRRAFRAKEKKLVKEIKKLMKHKDSLSAQQLFLIHKLLKRINDSLLHNCISQGEQRLQRQVTTLLGDTHTEMRNLLANSLATVQAIQSEPYFAPIANLPDPGTVARLTETMRTGTLDEGLTAMIALTGIWIKYNRDHDTLQQNRAQIIDQLDDLRNRLQQLGMMDELLSFEDHMPDIRDLLAQNIIAIQTQTAEIEEALTATQLTQDALEKAFNLPKDQSTFSNTEMLMVLLTVMSGMSQQAKSMRTEAEAISPAANLANEATLGTWCTLMSQAEPAFIETMATVPLVNSADASELFRDVMNTLMGIQMDVAAVILSPAVAELERAVEKFGACLDQIRSARTEPPVALTY